MAGTPITPFDLETVTTVAETDHLMIFSDGAENDITTLNFLKKLREITDANLADVRFATLDSNQKLNTAQLPTGYDFDAPLGNWSKDNDDPVLTDGTGTAGDSYVVVDTGTVAEGAGTLSLLDGVTVTAGDRIWYTGSVWDHAPKASNLFDGTTDADSAATAGDYYRKGAVDARQLSKAPANAAVFDGSASVLSNADASDLLVGGDGTNDNKLFARFAIYIDDLTSGFPICGRFDSAKREWFFSVNSSGFLFFRAYDDSAAQVVSATASTLPLVVGRWYIVELYYNGAGGASAMNGVTLRVNGVDCSVTVSNSGNYVAMEDKGGSFRVGEDNNGAAHSDGRFSGGIVGNTDMGGNGEFDLVVAPEDQWSDGTTATSGTLTVGKKYRINTFFAGDDFTNVGAASNATGVEFVATGTTPTTWTNSSVVGQVGALVSYQGRNIQSDGDIIDESSNQLDLSATSVTRLFDPQPNNVVTFTPTLSFGGASVGMTYDGQEGQAIFSADRKTVLINVRIALTAKGTSTGVASLALNTTDLTFKNFPNLKSIAWPRFFDINTAPGDLHVETVANSDDLNFKYQASTTIGNVSDTTFKDGTQFVFSGTFAIE